MRTPTLYPMTIHRIASTAAAVGAVAFCLVPGLAGENEPRGERDAALIERLIDGMEESGAAEERLIDGISKQQIVRTWSQRQERIETAAFQYTERTLTRAGRMGGMLGGSDQQKPVPSEDTWTINQCQLFLGTGANMRYLNEGPRWSIDRMEFDDGKYVITFNGTMGAQFFRALDGQPHHAGYVGATFPGSQNARLYPIIWTYRPLERGISFIDVDEWELVPEIIEVDGKVCVIIEQQVRDSSRTQTPPGTTRQLVLDIDLDFVPIQMRQTIQGELRKLVAINYDRDPQWGPVPMSWRCTAFGRSGSVLTAFAGTVESWSFNEHTPLGADVFAIDFPPGTILQDSRDGTITVLRRDGSRMSYTHDQFEAGNLPVGALNVDVPATRITQVLVLPAVAALGVLVVLLVCVLLLRWRHSIMQR